MIKRGFAGDRRVKGICSCTIIPTPSVYNSMYLVCLGSGTKTPPQEGVMGCCVSLRHWCLFIPEYSSVPKAAPQQLCRDTNLIQDTPKSICSYQCCENLWQLLLLAFCIPSDANAEGHNSKVCSAGTSAMWSHSPRTWATDPDTRPVFPTDAAAYRSTSKVRWFS